MEAVLVVVVAAAAVAPVGARVRRLRRSSSEAADAGRYLAEVLADARAA